MKRPIHGRKVCNGGFLLAELLTALPILALLMAALTGVFFTMHNAYRTGRAEMELQQEARIAADSILRDLLYADDVTAGDEKLEIVSGANRTRYALAPKDGRMRLMKDGQPVTGDSKAVEVSIDSLRFRRFNDWTVCVEIVAADRAHNLRFAVETAATLFNRLPDPKNNEQTELQINDETTKLQNNETETR